MFPRLTLYHSPVSGVEVWPPFPRHSFWRHPNRKVHCINAQMSPTNSGQTGIIILRIPHCLEYCIVRIHDEEERTMVGGAVK